MNTLLEASEHLSGLVKERELNQSVFMFSSIVEGFGAIDSVLTPTQVKSGEKRKKRNRATSFVSCPTNGTRKPA